MLGAALVATLGLARLASAAGGPSEDTAFVRSLYAGWYVPQAGAFEAEASRLRAALASWCGAAAPEEPAALDAAREQWTATLVAWERLAAVRGGALLARRSPREIDFTPTRPEAIRRAVEAAPADAHAMERVGAPGKGLPALEWLLWAQPARPGSPACRYAERAAEAVHREALALQQAYRDALSRGWDERETDYAMYEFLNLFDAGVQKLWWEDMARPLRRAATGASPGLSRTLSGTSARAWAAHWEALRALALGPGAQPPTLQALLLAKGQVQAAARLAEQVQQVDVAMAALAAGAAGAGPEASRVEIAATALQRLQQFVETDVAAALQFVISFFDEDGD